MLTVRDAASSPARLLTPLDNFDDALALLNRDRNAFPLAEHQHLLCMVTLSEVQKEIANGRGQMALGDGLLHGTSQEELTSENFPHVHMDHPVDVALRRMAQAKMNVLPVVSRSDVRELRGLVTLHDILTAYGVAEEERREEARAAQPAQPSRRILPGVVAAALALLILIGFLNYYYRAERGARAEQYFKTGTELAMQARNAEAIEQFRNALSVSPGNERYRLALGQTLVSMGSMNEGAVYLNEVLQHDPNNGAANLGLARTLASRGDKSNAVRYYHRAIDGSWPKGQEQSRIEVRFELADFLAKGGDKTQAIAELLAAMGQAPDAAEKERIGHLLLTYGAPRQAADVFRELIRANNRDADAYAGLGAAQLAQDNYTAARDALENAMRLDPSDETAKKELDVASGALALDPNARGIRGSERYERSLALLKSSLNMLEQCDAGANDNSQLLQSAQKALDQHPAGRILDDATEDNLTLAAQLWKAREKQCASQSPSDEAAARVLARLARE